MKKLVLTLTISETGLCWIATNGQPEQLDKYSAVSSDLEAALEYVRIVYQDFVEKEYLQ